MSLRFHTFAFCPIGNPHAGAGRRKAAMRKNGGGLRPKGKGINGKGKIDTIQVKHSKHLGHSSVGATPKKRT